ncbi:Ppx/GppA phosphatase family protein [Roseibium sp.]|uniref:Ppx/GppA phosphatase family protein n=1 Tax=Roseibium sp. TaxID=1936156 RepID=UPI003D12F6DB
MANPAQRKKKRRGRRRSTQAGSTSAVGSGNSQLEATGGALTAPQSDGVPSAKGKKAANRRGRKRWKAKKHGSQAEQIVQTKPIGGTTGSADTDPAAAVNGVSKPEGTHRPPEAPVRDPQFQRRPRQRGPEGNRHGHRRHSLPTTGNAPLYAALDLGTNNCRLLIARPEERGFRVVDAYSRIVRLGEGVGAHRRLGDAAMDRAIDALAQCHRKLAERGVERSRLIATEACRAAENGADFISRVQAETGLALEIVNRETEARLAVAGCASLVDHDADGVILFDIGGGSSEIVWLDLRNRCGARGYALTRFIRSWISLPVGVVNLAERHGGVHVTPDIFEAMVDDAADHLAEFNLADDLSEAISSGKVHMLGTSGTVTTLAGVHLGLRRYDRRRVDGTWLEDTQVGGMIDQLRDMPYEARVSNPCIGEDRADLVLAGCAILEAIRRRWSCPRLRVADRGLREGILTELMAADGVWARRKNGPRQGRGRPRNRQ